MICPGCHYLDDNLPNCTRCGGRGTLGEEVADTDGTDSTDLKKEDAVKTFAERLEGMRGMLTAKILERDFGFPDYAHRFFWAEVERVPRSLSRAPVDTVTRVLLRSLAWMAWNSGRIKRWQEMPGAEIVGALGRVLSLLERKNASYGNNALDPVRYFSRGSALELIFTRADDKLNRLRTAADAFGEEPLMDLAGYLVLALLAMEDEANIRAAKSGEGAKKKKADTDSTDGTDLGQDIRLAMKMAQKAKALKSNMECRNGGEVCALGTCTGIVCPVDSCDLEDGIRSMDEADTDSTDGTDLRKDGGR